MPQPDLDLLLVGMRETAANVHTGGTDPNARAANGHSAPHSLSPTSNGDKHPTSLSPAINGDPDENCHCDHDGYLDAHLSGYEHGHSATVGDQLTDNIFECNASPGRTLAGPEAGVCFVIMNSAKEKEKEIEMSEKRQVNGSKVRTARLIGSLAFRVFTAAICLFLITSPLWASSETDLAQQDTPVRIEPDQPTVTVSETFTTSVMIGNDSDLWALEFELLGIPDVITMDDLAMGDFTQGEGESPFRLEDLRLVDTFANSQVASDENGSWVIETVDGEGGYFSSLAIDEGGYPHISYGGLKYAYQDDSGWHIKPVDSGTSTSLILDERGYPHVSYHHMGLKYAYQDASGWHVEAVDSEGRVGYFSSLALDGSGYPHISYYDDANSDLKYAYQDASGWHIETVDSEGHVGYWASLALDASGYPHIGYFDLSCWDLKHAYQDAFGWHIERVDSGARVGAYASLALDANGYPHMSYYESSRNYDLKYAYQDASGWHIETVDREGVVGVYTSLALDEGGYPHISYCDWANHDLRYAYRNASGWHSEIVDSEGDVGRYTSLALDGDGHPYISYFDYTNYGLKYASRQREATIQAASDYTVYLPLIQKYTPPGAKLGVDFGAWATVSEVIDYDYPVAKEMGANWMRVFLPWFEIETARGEYHWDEYDAVFDRLGELGFDAIVVLYGAPDWAAEQSCGPITDTLALESFLEVVVPRYAGVVDAWEFINEPDGRVPHHLGPMIGCWGLYPAEYARQLGIFYSQIKRLDPDALVLFGGLAYDCWGHPEPYDVFERSFFEKTLQNGAGAYFDGVSLHYYPISPEMFPTMAHKVNEIRDTMSRNGVYWKKIWITETGMWINLNGSVEIQRDFIVRELTRGFGVGVDNIFWFEPREHVVPEGRVQRWLISDSHEPINGYTTFQHLAGKLEGMHCVGAYGDVPEDIEAYRFRSPERSLYVMWSNAMTETVRIPSTTDAVLSNRDGDESVVVPVEMGMVEFEVGVKPVFVEIADSG